MIKSAHFFVGFAYPHATSNWGQLFLNGDAFANVWINPAEYPPQFAGKWTLNRDTLAASLELSTEFPCFNSLEEMLVELERWFATDETQLKYHTTIERTPQ